jgi:hypothetical protein
MPFLSLVRHWDFCHISVLYTPCCKICSAAAMRNRSFGGFFFDIFLCIFADFIVSCTD